MKVPISEGQVLTEILSRVRRIETRIMRWAEMMGLDPSAKARPTYDKASNTIKIDGLDVSLQNVLDVLAKESISSPVNLEVQGLVVGTIVRGKRETTEEHS